MSAVPTFADPILSINPATTTVDVGQTVTLNIDIENADDLYAYNFDLLFDAGILQFLSITEGPFLDAGAFLLGTTADFLPGDGVSNLGTVSFTGGNVVGDFAGVSGNGTLAIATFLAIMDGMTFITFPDQLFVNSSFELAFGDSIKGTVNVNAVASVPEEPSMMILLAAVVALAAYRGVTRAS
jgi:hypothetical protein